MIRARVGVERSIKSAMAAENASSENRPETRAALRNILADFDSAYEAIVDIERQYSTNESYEGLRSSMLNAVATLKEKLARLSEGGVPADKLVTGVRSGFQGLGGFNRYTVLTDGTIRLSAAHSIGPCVKKSKEVGVLVEDFRSDDNEKPCPCGSGKEYFKCHGV